VELVPDTGLVPGRQAPPPRHARPEPELLGQLPLDAGVQNEQDPAHSLPVRHPRPPLHLFGGGSGSNGSMSDHSSSDTIHGRD